MGASNSLIGHEQRARAEWGFGFKLKQVMNQITSTICCFMKS